MRAWWNRFRVWSSGRRQLDHDLAEELATHLAMEVEDRTASGLPPAEARGAAGGRFGNRTAIAEHARDTWGFPSLESLLHDVRYGFRALRRTPGFSLVVILTFALGIGVNTAVFSVVRSVLLEPLPYPHSERLVRLEETAGRTEGISVTWGNFHQWRAGNRSFEDMAAYRFTSRTMTGGDQPIVTQGIVTTAAYFPLLGMQPLLGRLFGPVDDRPGAPPVVVLNYRFWSGRLHGDPQIVGQTLTLDGNGYQIVGVAAPLWEQWQTDYYLPLAPGAGNPADRRQHNSTRVLALLKPGVTLAAGRADLDAIMKHLAEVDPGPEDSHTSYGRFLAESTTGDLRGTLLVLMGAASLILLIACANIASLLLARNSARSGELALRTAIGAGRLRLMRQLLTETTVIAAAGGLAGIGLAYATLRVLIALAPPNIPRLAETAIEPSVLLFACGLTVAAGLLAGLAPMLVAGRIELSSALKEGARAAGAGRHRQSFRNALVVAEVALTFVLAFGSGLLLRSLIAAQKTSPGFEPRQVLSFAVQLPRRSYPGPEAVTQFYTRLLADLRALPGVAETTAACVAPGTGECNDWFYSIPGRPNPGQGDVPLSLFNVTDAGYFHVMRIATRQGREFNALDRANEPKVAIVNETFARRWWPRESAVGRQIKVGGPYQKGDLLEIVGVAADARQFGLDGPVYAEIYQPSSQKPSSTRAILIRTVGDPNAIAAAVRSRVAALDRNLPLEHLESLEQRLGEQLGRRRFVAALLTFFACLALALAAIGIYGLLSYWVASREPEIAIRLALGARPSTILYWTSLHAMRLAGMGIAFGLLGSWIVVGGIQELLFGVPSRSPATMVLAALAVALLALAAAAVPARRAARIDPSRRLHSA